MIKGVNKIIKEYTVGMKVEVSKSVINSAIDRFGREGLYISFSGGKDSTVLHHLVKEVELERFGDVQIPRVWCDTGLEFPELKEFARGIADEIIRPDMSFREVLYKYGYPITTKTQANSIRKLKTMNLSDKYRNKLMHGDERGKAGKVSERWKFLLDSKLPVSDECCNVMKKRPFDKYQKRTKRIPITGELIVESTNRKFSYIQGGGCNDFDRDHPKSKPLSLWNTDNILEYIKKNNIEIASVYGDVIEVDGKYKTTGEQRTGCIFCAFGVHLEKGENRFQRLRRTHPELHSYCMDKLGMKDVLEFINVEWM